MLEVNSYSINTLFSEWDNQSLWMYILCLLTCVHMENMRLAFTELLMFVSFLVINSKSLKFGAAMIFLFEFCEVQFYLYTQRDIWK